MSTDMKTTISPCNMGMRLNEYQEKAMSTCMDSCDNITYMAMNLASEVGELQGVIAKAVRKGQARIDFNDLNFTCGKSEEFKEILAKMKDELGDVLWQVVGLANAMGWSINDIAVMNLKKLQKRRAEGMIADHTEH